MLICPICKNALQQKDKIFQCQNNHCFDLASSGYLNLLLLKSSSGDNREMVNARHAFLAKGYFERLVASIISLMASLDCMKRVLDCGCGEGYFLDKCKSAFPEADFFGLDISKYAIDKAARKRKDILHIVASAAKIPFSDESFDLVINIFAPHFLEEFARVLKPGGHILKVTPGPKHLLELKEVLYEKVYLNEIDTELPGYSLQNTSSLTYRTKISDDLHNLLKMTPYFYKTPARGLEKISTLKELEITFDFNISLYKK